MKINNSGGINILFLFLSVAICPALAAAQESHYLDALYQRAISVSERIKRSETEIYAAEARYRQALSAVMPRVDANYNYSIRDNENFGRLAGTNLDPSGNPTNSPSRVSTSPGSTQAEAFFSLSQPIFSGFRDFILLDAAESELKAFRMDLTREKDLLFLDVAELFFQIRLYEKLNQILRETGRTLQERVTELSEFVKLGKSRESEIRASEAEYADIEALQASIEGILSASREALSFLVGIPADQLKLSKAPLVVRAIEPLQFYLDRAAERSDLKAFRYRYESQKQVVKAATREHWPVVSLDGRAYPYEEPDRSREWDMIFRITIPVFHGGAIQARVAEARALAHLSELSYSELKRLTERDIRTAYSNITASTKEFDANNKLLKAVKNSLLLQKKDYELGVITNLDVLRSIRNVQDAERRLIDTQIATELNRVRLEIASGGPLL